MLRKGSGIYVCMCAQASAVQFISNYFIMLIITSYKRCRHMSENKPGEINYYKVVVMPYMEVKPDYSDNLEGLQELKSVDPPK